MPPFAGVTHVNLWPRIDYLDLGRRGGHKIGTTATALEVYRERRNAPQVSALLVESGTHLIQPSLLAPATFCSGYLLPGISGPTKTSKQ